MFPTKLQGISDDFLIQVQNYSKFINNENDLDARKKEAESQLKSIGERLARLTDAEKARLTEVMRAAVARANDPQTRDKLGSPDFEQFEWEATRPDVAEKGRLFAKHFLAPGSPPPSAFSIDRLISWMFDQHREFVTRFDQARASTQLKGAARKKALEAVVKRYKSVLFALALFYDNSLRYPFNGPMAEISKLLALWAVEARPVGKPARK